MAAPAPDFFHLETTGGQRLCIHHRPAAAARAAVLQIHAFAEEMNKTRRMAHLQSRAFAEAGFAVLQIDLHGCGDSSGDFGDAGWQSWIDDVRAAAGWLLQQHDAPLILWGVRAGCLLACAAGRSIPQASLLLGWQPPAQGKQVLQQFLRLGAAAELADGDAKGALARLRRQLADGAAVEIAGYMLSAELAAALEAATLDPWPGLRGAAWLEVSSRPDATPSPALALAVERWSGAGVATSAGAVEGIGFWQSTEVELAPALLAASTAAAARLAASA